MNVVEHQISYSNTNSYSTLNKLTESTKNVWIVFHGIGYLSRYFLKHFDTLNAKENFVIAPQAPSKYYLNNTYKHVGASWLTKDDPQTGMENILNYLDAIFSKIEFPKNCNIIIFGFSQGVSIALRWMARRRIICDQLILYAGGIPTELKPEDFEFLPNTTKIKVIIGDKDEYLTEERMISENKKIEFLFNGDASLIIFKGKHEVKKELIESIV